ncbi:MAG: hypothetical protein R3181_06275 [Rubricoccaceae bacterium]|nr:hypothetical protein [Rubricoccaceae bacterium]
MSLLLAATLLGLVKAVLVALLAVLNAMLAAFATVAIWKTYLALGLKVALVALVFVPVVGVLVYYLWARKTVRDAQA